MVPENIDEIANLHLNFVIGKERSGTTLLQAMLNSHPNIVAPPESRFIMRLYARYSNKRWTENTIRQFCDELYTEKIFSEYWGIDKNELITSLLKFKDRLTYPLVCKLVFHLHAAQGKQVKMYVDKNPLYYYFIPEINKLYPQAKYVHIVREYHANIVSHKRIITVNMSMADMAYRWLKVHEMLEETKKRMPGQWITVKYETLVTEPEATMKSVCGFLGVQFDPVMVEKHSSSLYPSFYKNIDTNEGFRKIHQNVFQPITTSFIDEWKDKLTDKEVTIIESITGKYAEETYGYKGYSTQKDFRLSPFVMLKVKFKYKLIRFYFRQFLRRRWGFILHKYVLRHLLRAAK